LAPEIDAVMLHCMGFRNGSWGRVRMNTETSCSWQRSQEVPRECLIHQKYASGRSMR